MRRKFLLIVIAIIFIAMNLAARESGTFKDVRDGQVYQTFTINGQTWMAQNLNYNSGNSGCALGFSACCCSWCYGDVQSNCIKFGRLYDFATAMEAAPKGWHLPSKEEFNILIASLNGLHDPSSYQKYLGIHVSFWTSTATYVDHGGVEPCSITVKGGGISVITTDSEEGLSVRLVKDK